MRTIANKSSFKSLVNLIIWKDTLKSRLSKLIEVKVTNIEEPTVFLRVINHPKMLGFLVREKNS